MTAFLCIVLGYVLGSAPWGLVIARTFCGIDPRNDGSRNTGATNVARLCGFRWGGCRAKSRRGRLSKTPG